MPTIVVAASQAFAAGQYSRPAIDCVLNLSLDLIALRRRVKRSNHRAFRHPKRFQECACLGEGTDPTDPSAGDHLGPLVEGLSQALLGLPQEPLIEQSKPSWAIFLGQTEQEGGLAL